MNDQALAVARRYIDMWNLPDPRDRRRAVEDVWAPDAEHFTPTRQFKGYDALEARVLEAYNQWVLGKGYLFHVLGEPLSHHGIVKLHWKMQHTVTNAIDSYGSDVLLLAPDDRVLVDYQFLEPRPAGA